MFLVGRRRSIQPGGDGSQLVQTTGEVPAGFTLSNAARRGLEMNREVAVVDQRTKAARCIVRVRNQLLGAWPPDLAVGNLRTSQLLEFGVQPVHQPVDRDPAV